MSYLLLILPVLFILCIVFTIGYIFGCKHGWDDGCKEELEEIKAEKEVELETDKEEDKIFNDTP